MINIFFSVTIYIGQEMVREKILEGQERVREFILGQGKLAF